MTGCRERVQLNRDEESDRDEGIETSVEGRGVGSPAASLLSSDCSEQSAEPSS